MTIVHRGPPASRADPGRREAFALIEAWDRKFFGVETHDAGGFRKIARRVASWASEEMGARMLLIATPAMPTNNEHPQRSSLAARSAADGRRSSRERSAADLRGTVEKHTGITDRRILNAIERVPRERFVPVALRQHAYEDRALPIGLEQTISQPSMVALMLAELDCLPHHDVLEVGSGSGYAAALLAQLAATVHGIERHPELAHRSRATLSQLGLANVTIEHGDGTRLSPERRFDRILVSAAAAAVPATLVSALAPGGRLVIPVGSADQQTLLRVDIGADGMAREQRSIPCIFVPLIDDDPARASSEYADPQQH